MAGPSVASRPPAATADPTLTAFARLLAARSDAWRDGDVDRAEALVAADAPPAFREHERQLATLAKDGVPIVPVASAPVALPPLGALRPFQVTETDSQGRARRIRYFATGPLDGLRLTEPTKADLGEPATVRDDRFDVRAFPLDAEPCAAAQAFAAEGVGALVATLGAPYRPASRISLDCLPTVQPDLPPLASAYTRGNVITLLTSQSTIVAAGPGAEWSRTVVVHEVAHVLLFARGNGPFVLAEGLPLWLTDDRRQPELDRLVRSNALWTLDHLIAGPNDDTEFFAGYAQASSFVRFLAATYGAAAVVAAWESGRVVTFAAAFARGFALTPDAAYQAWRASLAR